MNRRVTTVSADANGSSIQGFGDVMTNLNREIGAIVGRTMGGLIDAAIIIRRATETEEPKVPVDTGNLRHSWFTSSFYDGQNPGLFLGFSANYALWVHENVGADFTSPRKHRKTGKMYTPRQGSGAKFLEAKINTHHDDILNAIKNKAQIP
jgi:hypothetical protein